MYIANSFLKLRSKCSDGMDWSVCVVMLNNTCKNKAHIAHTVLGNVTQKFT